MEIWKDIKGYENMYQVSNTGRVRSLDRTIIRSDGKSYKKKGKECRYQENGDGYLLVKLSKNGVSKYMPVHRLVATTFIPTDDSKKEINHIDCNRKNNNVENLEWLTHRDNVRHSAKKGHYSRKGTKNSRAKYTEEEVTLMRELYDSGMTVMEVINTMFPELEYKLRKNKWSRVSDICKRKTYI